MYCITNFRVQFKVRNSVRLSIDYRAGVRERVCAGMCRGGVNLKLIRHKFCDCDVKVRPVV